MSTNRPYRRHNPQFKLQLRYDIRGGRIGRREAQWTYRISANLIQMWLNQSDRGEFDNEEAAVLTIAEYEVKAAALECKVGQPTMEVDLLRKTSHLSPTSSNENSSIVSGLSVAPPIRGTA